MPFFILFLLFFVGFSGTVDAETTELHAEIVEEVPLVDWDKLPSKITFRFSGGEEIMVFPKQEALFGVVERNMIQLGSRWIKVQQLPEDKSRWNIKTTYETRVDVTNLQTWLATQKLTQESYDKVKISEVDGKVIFEGFPKRAYALPHAQVERALNELVGTSAPAVIHINAPFTYSGLDVDESLTAEGILEPLAIGESNFYGSKAGRVQNIVAGSKRFQGKVVKQGEDFSFNTTLGGVLPEYGFTKAKVIKSGEIEYEFGGGVCQVSTTLYRSALLAGLPIPNRRNHSWVIPYYGKPGLDATIYLGSQDLIFTNNTPADLLIQYEIQGTRLRFALYGTNDGRSVHVTKPEVLYVRPIPDPVKEFDPDLPAGAEIRVENGIKGMDTRVERIISMPDGEVITEEIISKYSAKPPKVKVGPDLPKAPEPVPESVEDMPKLEFVEPEVFSYPTYGQ